MDITLKQLNVFMAVAQNGNLTKAAEQLFMTKGAVSQTIAELESRLEMQLFDRHHARIFLNSKGRQLMPVADELLARAQDIQHLFDQHHQDKSLLVGCSKTIGSYMLPDLLSTFKQQYHWLPKITIENTHELCKKLENFELDIAMVEGVIHSPDIVVTPWCEDEMVVIAAKDHPLAQLNEVTWEALAQQPWLLREKGSGSRTYFETHLLPLLSEANIVLTLGAFDAILFCVNRGLGITFASRRMIENEFFSHQFAQLQTEKKFLRTLNLCWHKNKHMADSTLEWRDFLKKAAIA